MADPAELKALVHDHESGAQEIARSLMGVLQRQATASRADSATLLAEEVFDTALKVLRAHPEMGVLLDVVDSAFARLEAVEDAADGVGAFRMEAVAVLQEEAKRVAGAASKAAANAAQRVENGDVVVTYSRSSTVLDALLMARDAGKTFDVVLSESRPLLEGRRLAGELSDAQVPVRLMVDAALPGAAAQADRVLIGGDAVTRSGLVNKVGTSMVAQAATAAEVPVEAVVASAKAWRKKVDPIQGLRGQRPRPAAEVWDKGPVGVEVLNVTYELVPSRWVSRLVTEDGALSFEEFWQRHARRARSRRVAQAMAEELEP